MLSLRRSAEAFRRALALGLAALVVVGTLDWGHVSDDDDGAWQASVVEHDHAAHRLRPPADRSQAGPEHCYLCHWVRLLGAPAPNLHHGASLTVRERLIAGGSDGDLRFATVQIPARSPPA
jgi:hypothetical protein